MDKKLIHLTPESQEWENSIACFFDRWFDAGEYMEFKTSGSTGTPKSIRAKKNYMKVSASNTIDFLGLQEGDTALLCLPVDYISGSMMLVRSLVGNLKLYTTKPCLNPFFCSSMPFDFVAMTASQVFKTLENKRQRELFCSSRNIIIGGSALDKSLEDKLKNIDTNIYSTYGMTETLSHIALRKIDKTSDSDWYKPLRGVNVSLSKDNTLVIDADSISDDTIITNDIAEINADGNFRILGRLDNVINTGGVKVQIEDIERKLSSNMGISIVATYVQDDLLGQKIVLLIKEDCRHLQNEIDIAIKSLSKYERPKHILFVENLPFTRTGKYDRVKARHIAENKILNSQE